MIFKKISKNIKEMQQMATTMKPSENGNTDQVQLLNETDTLFDEDKDTGFEAQQILIEQQLRCFGILQQKKTQELQELQRQLS